MDDDRTWPSHGRAAADGEVRQRLARLTTSLQASPAELTGLCLLLLGGLMCLGVLVWWARPALPDAGVATPDIPLEVGGVGAVTVHVAGAVARPGVVELPGSARVLDAIAAAGGATVLADVGALNLARTVADGERIEVPSRGSGGSGTADAGSEGAFDPEGRLDLNRATADELETLPGIGPVLAARIVEHRDEHGPFASAGELREVPGIGERSFQALAELVVVR